MPKLLATWNRARGVWETERASLLCEHLEPYSPTWPTSGTTRNGVAYELPTWAPRMAGSGSSSLPTPLPTVKATNNENRQTEGRYGPNLGMALMKTPTAQLAINGGSQHPDKRKEGGHGPTLADQIEHLLPTPKTTDMHHSSPADASRNSPGLRAIHALLPTPAVNDMGEGKTVEAWDEWTAKMKAAHANGNGHGPSLAIEAARLLPTPDASMGNGGRQRSQAALDRGDHQANLNDLGRLIGASTPLPSTAGNTSWDDQPLPLYDPTGNTEPTGSTPQPSSS